jgi:hypothetical protein
MKCAAILWILSLFSISAHAWTATITTRTGKDGKTVQKFGYVKNEFKLNRHEISAPKPFKCDATLTGITPLVPAELQSPRNVDVECSLSTATGTAISHNFRCEPNDDGVGLSHKGSVSVISVSCEDD